MEPQGNGIRMRYIPEEELEIIEAEKAEAFLDKMAKKCYVQSIWCGPATQAINIRLKKNII